MSDEKPMGQVIQIDEARIRDHLGEMVRGTVEETLNAMLDARQTSFAGPDDPSELTALATRSETLRTSPAQLRFITMPSR